MDYRIFLQAAHVAADRARYILTEHRKINFMNIFISILRMMKAQ